MEHAEATPADRIGGGGGAAAAGAAPADTADRDAAPTAAPSLPEAADWAEQVGRRPISAFEKVLPLYHMSPLRSSADVQSGSYCSTACFLQQCLKYIP